MSEWRRTTIAEIADPSPRSIAIGPFGSSLKADLYTAVGIPVVRGQNIVDSAALSETDVVFVSAETAQRLPACIVRDGDLVFPHRGAIGRVGIVKNRTWLLSSSMMKLTCDVKMADPRFVFYYFRGPGKRELLTRASTVGTPGIAQPLSSLRNIPIHLPQLSEQRAIAEVLGALDDKIAANSRLARLVDEYLSTLLRNAIVDHQKWSTLDSIATVNQSSVKPESEKCLRYVDIASVGIGEFDFPSLSSWADAPGRARRKVKRGDTLWSTVRPNRRSHALNLSDDPTLVASTGLAVLTPTIAGFAYLYEVTRLPEFTAYLENVAEGSAYPAVRADRFKSAPIPVLEDERRRRFESVAAPMREHVHSSSEENRTLVATRDALLPQLMSGKLRAKDAESLVADAV